MELTWLGHSTFRLDAEGKRVYIDPFLTGNPKCPEAEQTPEHVDVIVTPDAKVLRADPTFGTDGGRLGHDQARAAYGPAAQVDQMPVGCQTIGR